MDNIKGIQRKISRTLFTAQSLISAALIATATITSIVGAELSGITAWAGVPATIFLLSSAIGSLGWGYLMERKGRRWGLTLGLFLGTIGSGLAGYAIWQFSFILFLAGMSLTGLGQSAMLLGRYAAADVYPPTERGRAIANVVLGGTVGAVVGPLLVSPAGSLATSLELNELIGPFGVSLILFIIGTFLIYFWLRPEPLEVAGMISVQDIDEPSERREDRSLVRILSNRKVIAAVLSMVIGQAVMVMIMVITSLHMRDLDFPLTSISLVITAHTLGMYAFSIFTGKMVDSIGRERVIILGAGILIVAGASSGLSPELLPIIIALFLLGLGWNFCFIGGSTLLTDQLTQGEQSRTQGTIDLMVGMASAFGSLGSGFVFASVGYRAMGLIGAALSVIPLFAAIWLVRKMIVEEV